MVSRAVDGRSLTKMYPPSAPAYIYIYGAITMVGDHQPATPPRFKSLSFSFPLLPSHSFTRGPVSAHGQFTRVSLVPSSRELLGSVRFGSALVHCWRSRIGRISALSVHSRNGAAVCHVSVPTAIGHRRQRRGCVEPPRSAFRTRHSAGYPSVLRMLLCGHAKPASGDARRRDHGAEFSSCSMSEMHGARFCAAQPERNKHMWILDAAKGESGRKLEEGGYRL
jgi:hypothetical protein